MLFFLVDSMAAIQALQSETEESRTTKGQLEQLATEAKVAIQWIPSHCDIPGNEKADALAKQGSQMPQPPLTYQEAKRTTKQEWRHKWLEKNCGYEAHKDPMHSLNRWQQKTLFRLRTGHSRLNSHLHRLKIASSPLCPCIVELKKKQLTIYFRSASFTLMHGTKHGRRRGQSTRSFGALPMIS